MAGIYYKSKGIVFLTSGKR